MQITFAIYWSYNQPIGTKFSRYNGGGSGSADGLPVATRAGGGDGGPAAYYRHVLMLDRLAGRCVAVTGGLQPSTPGERFKKLASVIIIIIIIKRILFTCR